MVPVSYTHLDVYKRQHHHIVVVVVVDVDVILLLLCLLLLLLLSLLFVQFLHPPCKVKSNFKHNLYSILCTPLTSINWFTKQYVTGMLEDTAVKSMLFFTW